MFLFLFLEDNKKGIKRIFSILYFQNRFPKNCFILFFIFNSRHKFDFMELTYNFKGQITNQEDFEKIISKLSGTIKAFGSNYGLFSLSPQEGYQEIKSYEDYEKLDEKLKRTLLWKPISLELLNPNHSELLNLEQKIMQKKIVRYVDIYQKYQKYLELDDEKKIEKLSEKDFSIFRFLDIIPYSCTYQTFNLGNGRHKMIKNTFKEVKKQTLTLREHLELIMDNPVNQMEHSYLHFLKTPEFTVILS